MKKYFLRQGNTCKSGKFLTHNSIIELNTEMYLAIYYLKPKILNAKVCAPKYKVY